MVENDYYSILGVDRNASDKEIKRAFRRLALRYHPDRCPGDPGSEERFKEINEAYAVLGNAGKRREYDHFGPRRFRLRYGEDDLFRAFDFEAIFGELGLRVDEEFVDRVFCRRRWKGCGRGRQKFLRRGLNRGFPFNTMEWDRRIYDLPVSRNEATHGTEREIVVETNGLRRRYLIRVPAGVMSGARLRISLDEDTLYFEVRLVP